MQQSAPQTHPRENVGAFKTKTATNAARLSIPQIPTARLLMAVLLSCALAMGPAVNYLTKPTTAFAETTEIDARPSTLQQEIERTATEYDKATARVAETQKQIDTNESKIKRLQANLPLQQKRGASAMRALYQLQQETPGLIEMLLNAESLDDFLTTFEYVDHIQQRSMAELERLKSMKDDLDATQSELKAAHAAAQAEQTRAQEALTAAQTARQEAQRQAQEEAARRAAQAEAAQAAAALAAAQAAEQEAAPKPEDVPPEPPDNTNEETVVSPPPEGVDWSSDKQAFVAQWSARIDAYLAGSPLAGQGATFAASAWNYGVDPRWSPAISNTESTKGAYCFRPYNAWGWGNVSWGSWEEAIDAHVRGLANGYGYTISVEAAKKYAGNWQHWYDATLAQMNMI